MEALEIWLFFQLIRVFSENDQTLVEWWTYLVVVHLVRWLKILVAIFAFI